MRKILSVFLGALLLTGIAHAEIKSYYSDIFLGLNTKSSERLLKDTESPDCQNYTLDETGAIKEREFFGQYNSAAGDLGNNPVSHIAKLYKSDGNKYFVAAAGSNICQGSGGTWSSIGQSTISSTTAPWYSATLNDGLHLANRDNILQDWNGTSSSTTTLFSGAQHPLGIALGPTENVWSLTVHKNRMWAVGTTHPNRLFYCSLNNSYDWATTGGYLDIFVNDGDEITGLAVLGPYLYVFKEFSIYVVVGTTPNEFSIQKTNSEVGCIAPRTIQVTDVGIMFLSRTGVFIFNGSTSTKITDKIEPTINSISSSRIADAAGLYDKQNHYYLSYTSRTGTYNDSCIVYNTLLKEWYPLGNLDFDCFFKAEGAGDKSELYAGSSRPIGIVYQLQTESAAEQLIHDTQAEFQSGVTDNLVCEADNDVVQEEGGITDATYLTLHFSEVDGATSTEDASFYNKTATFLANAQIDRDMPPKFYPGSLYLDGAGDTIRYAANDHWDITSSDYTVDFWVKLVTHAGFDCFATLYVDGNNAWIIARDDGSLVGNGINFRILQGGTTVDTGWAGDITDSDWHHIAMVKVGNYFGMYKDGVLVTSTGPDTDTFTLAGQLYIGSFAGGNYFIDGYMDEFRITRGNPFDASPDVAGDVFPLPVIPYKPYSYYGTINSDNLKINASGQASLGAMTWIETDSYTDKTVKFQTRTGTTDTTIFYGYQSWETWASENSVTINYCNDETQWDSSSSGNLVVIDAPATTSSIEVIFHEDEYAAVPDCIEIDLADGSSNSYAVYVSEPIDLSSMEFISGWWKSEITGDVISFGISETEVFDAQNYITFNTVTANTWAKFYMDLSGFAATDRDAITSTRIMYVGNGTGTVRQGAVWFDSIIACDFLDSGDTCISTPDDYVQYRMIGGSATENTTFSLNQWKLVYTPTVGNLETDVDYEYSTNDTKFEDSGRITKQFLEYNLWLEGDYQTPYYVDWNTDYGDDSGTFTFDVATTGRTINLKEFFPPSTHGKTIQRRFYRDDATQSSVIIRAEEITYAPEPYGSD